MHERLYQIKTKLIQIEKEKKSNYDILQSLVQDTKNIEIKNHKLEINTNSVTSNKYLYESYFQSISSYFNENVKLQKQLYYPDINLEYFQY